MTTMNDDDELRRRFAELKAQDARTAPSFEKTRAAAMTTAAATPRKRKTSPLLYIVPLTMSFAAAAVILLFIVFQRSSASAPAASEAATPAAAMGGEKALATRRAIDPAPLDFLLDTSLHGERARTAYSTNPIRGW